MPVKITTNHNIPERPIRRIFPLMAVDFNGEEISGTLNIALRSLAYYLSGVYGFDRVTFHQITYTGEINEPEREDSAQKSVACKPGQ